MHGWRRLFWTDCESNGNGQWWYFKLRLRRSELWLFWGGGLDRVWGFSNYSWPKANTLQSFISGSQWGPTISRWVPSSFFSCYSDSEWIVRSELLWVTRLMCWTEMPFCAFSSKVNVYASLSKVERLYPGKISQALSFFHGVSHAR